MDRWIDRPSVMCVFCISVDETIQLLRNDSAIKKGESQSISNQIFDFLSI